ncbi:hypothetical protein ABZ639_24000 [Saccharomonospora sp. NPDC006951]
MLPGPVFIYEREPYSDRGRLPSEPGDRVALDVHRHGRPLRAERVASKTEIPAAFASMLGVQEADCVRVRDAVANCYLCAALPIEGS